MDVGEDGGDGDSGYGDSGDRDRDPVDARVGNRKGESKDGRGGAGNGDEGRDGVPAPKGKGDGVEGGCGDREAGEVGGVGEGHCSMKAGNRADPRGNEISGDGDWLGSNERRAGLFGSE